MRRRQFLRGLGGLTLGLPFLPSLLPKNAQSAPGDMPKRFIAMATNHGGVWQESMFPNRDTLTDTRMYAGHEIRSGRLSRQINAGRAAVSPVLSASSASLTDGLIDKINVLEGVDIPFYIAHHTGGHLGNYARNDGNGTAGKTVQNFPRPTIDQLMAWSDEFYPSLDGVLERSMVVGSSRMSYGYSNPSMQMGDIQEVSSTSSSLSLFRRIFTPEESEDSMRTPIADRVLENYRRLRDSNRRLSSDDRRRLDDHIQRIDELQRRLNTAVSCGDIQEPTLNSRDVQREMGYRFDPEKNKRFWQLMNEVIAVGMSCGTSRVATMRCADRFSTFPGDWHQDIAHKASSEGTAQTTIADAHQRFFEDVFVDLIARLDVEEAPGETILDNSLVMWTQECGPLTHHSHSIPIVTAGSAGGYFDTGNYVDYRNLNFPRRGQENSRLYSGIVYNQWLGTVLESMGVSRSTFEEPGVGGYGHFYIGTSNGYETQGFYTGTVQDVLGEKLPVITT